MIVRNAVKTVLTSYALPLNTLWTIKVFTTEWVINIFTFEPFVGLQGRSVTERIWVEIFLEYFRLAKTRYDEKGDWGGGNPLSKFFVGSLQGIGS